MGYFMFYAFLRALETNKYNHITATYFLLAERILREKQEKEIQTRSASPSNIKAQFRWEFRNLNGWERFGFFLFVFKIVLMRILNFSSTAFLETVKYFLIAKFRCLQSTLDTSKTVQKSVVCYLFNSYPPQEMTRQFEVCF